MDALKIISEGSIKAEKPQFNVGDTVRVDVRIKDGDRERIQAFEGTVIARLPRSRAIFDHPRFETGRKCITCFPFFLFQSPGVCVKSGKAGG